MNTEWTRGMALMTKRPHDEKAAPASDHDRGGEDVSSRRHRAGKRKRSGATSQTR
jgi:hypothetical protein